MQYDDKGRLTRAGAEQVIRGGGSVSIGGRTYATLESLPDEAAFAKGDTRAEDAARERLRQQAADIQRQLDALGAGGPSTTAAGFQTANPDPSDGVRTITGDQFGPRPVRAANADAFPAADPAAGDAAADKADADDDAKARKGKGK